MKNNLLILIFLLAFAISAHAADITNFGAVADDNLSDFAAINAANNAVRLTGGTVIFPNGEFVLDDTVDLINNLPENNRSFPRIRWQCSYGTVIKIAVNSETKAAVWAVNISQFIIDGCNFVGDMDTTFNAQDVFRIYANQTLIQNSAFYGIGAKETVFRVSGQARFENVQFYGSTAVEAIIHSDLYLTANNIQFLDYGNFRGSFLTKLYLQPQAWIFCDVTPVLAKPPFPNSYLTSGVFITQMSGDEGAKYQIKLKNVFFAQLKGISGNVASTDGAAGVFADNSQVDIKKAWFGFSHSPNPALQAVNNSKIKAFDIAYGDGVKLSEAATGGAVYCADCAKY